MTTKFATRTRFVPAQAPVSYTDGVDPKVDLLFDYGEFPPVVADKMRAHATAIKTSFRRWGTAMVDIGRELEAAKNDCAGMPKGTYRAWVEQEFGLKIRMAEHMVEVANRTALIMQSDKWHLLTDSSLYALASASTPDAAIEATFAKAEANGGLTHAAVKDVIDEHREDRLTVDEVYALLDAAVAGEEEYTLYRDDHARVKTLFPAGKTATVEVIREAVRRMGIAEIAEDDESTIDGEYTVVQDAPGGRELTVEQLRDGLWLAIRSACHSQDLREQAGWLEAQPAALFAKYLPADGIVLARRLKMALSDVAGSLRQIYAEQVQILAPIDLLAMQVAEMQRMFATRDGWVAEYVELTGDDGNVRRLVATFDAMLRNVTPPA